MHTHTHTHTHTHSRTHADRQGLQCGSLDGFIVFVVVFYLRGGLLSVMKSLVNELHLLEEVPLPRAAKVAGSPILGLRHTAGVQVDEHKDVEGKLVVDLFEEINTLVVFTTILVLCVLGGGGGNMYEYVCQQREGGRGLYSQSF